MLTRVGEGSRLVITGDLLQSDRLGTNGLADFYNRIRGCVDPSIRLVDFGVGDVQRSPVVASILRMYEKPGLKGGAGAAAGAGDAAIIPLGTEVKWEL